MKIVHSRTTVRARGQITLPREIRAEYGIEEGDPVLVEVTEDGILLRPQKVIDSAQAWFWTPEWQAGEREASADVADGRMTRYGSAKEFLGSIGRVADAPSQYASAKKRARHRRS
jgi:AbrB family looped-hinge helix DNA binding protein